MFIEFGLIDIIDIFLVALMLFYIYRLMRESRSLNVFIGIMVFVVIWLFVSQIIQMRLLGSILDKLVSVGVIALIVLFQEDIRMFLYNLGAHRRMRSFMRFFSKDKGKDKKEVKETIMPIVMSCMNLSKGKVGALIVLERTVPLDDIVRTGDMIDATINQRLIENIFFKNSPLHDASRLLAVSFLSVMIWIFRRSWDCVTVPRWVSRRRVMPWLLWCRKRLAVSLWLCEENFVSVSLQRSSRPS